MLDQFKSEHRVDQNGRPAGGTTEGTGLLIEWQNGPLMVDGVRKEPNGAFVETVIAAAKERIEFYQTAAQGMFSCGENAEAIEHLSRALEVLDKRTKRREKAGVEGTHAQAAGDGVAAEAKTEEQPAVDPADSQSDS